MIGTIWDTIILSPLINVLVVLSNYLAGSFGLTIIVLTILIRAAMYPLTVKQLKASKAMQSIQAEVAEVRKKYAKDRKKAAEEQMRLYRESGMNPAGCLLPMLIQMPIWIALYQSIIRVLAVVPEDFLNLSPHLYSTWGQVFSLVPLENRFLWLDLALPDRWLLLPILVGGTMWVQQKMVMPSTGDPKQQAQSQMMLWMMPLMFAFLTMSFPSGLALYWVTSNIISIVMQYFVTGWGGLVFSSAAGKKPAVEKKRTERTVRQKPALTETETSADIVIPRSAEEEELEDGKSGDKSENSRGSDRTRLGATRRKPGRGGGYRPKGR
ncbi:MAG: membrane protein insertase YidC [Chloroflexi bacterium]|nr:membrane protein insertase YidC [Chloroflexota bacterium]